MTSRNVPRLMLVTDRVRAALPLPEVARCAIEGGVDIVQIREKDLPIDELRTHTEHVIAAVGDRSRVSINSALTIAADLGTGVHLPEHGVSPAEARRILGDDALIGRSVHSPASATAGAGADYLIAGHVFATASKPDLPPIGLDGLRRIAGSTSIPILAIGGITAANVQSVLEAGAFGAAVMSAINASSNPRQAAREICDCMRLEKANSMTATATTIDLTINGKPVALDSGTTVQRYLESKGYHERLVVVELNEAILPRSAFASTVLTAGDRVEVVHFVGGG